jgi:Uri superfamily endonuclease
MIKSGVYKITSKIDGKVYVGSTIVSVDGRISRHKRELRNNLHKNKKLQNHYHKFGSDSL